MSVTKEQVEHIAKLAKLTFSESEKESMTKDLNTILDYMDKLNELDTSNVETLMFMTQEEKEPRQDQPQTCLPINDVLNNAPDKEDRFFKVPKVIS